jgi:hypothetical protein
VGPTATDDNPVDGRAVRGSDDVRRTAIPDTRSSALT